MAGESLSLTKLTAHTHSFYVLKEEGKQEVSAACGLSCIPGQQA